MEIASLLNPSDHGRGRDDTLGTTPPPSTVHVRTVVTTTLVASVDDCVTKPNDFFAEKLFAY